MSQGFPPSPSIEFLVDSNGEIIIGSIASISCAVTASDDHQSFAMLVRRDDKSLGQVLIRLDRAIGMAVEDDIFIDEINHGIDERL